MAHSSERKKIELSIFMIPIFSPRLSCSRNGVHWHRTMSDGHRQLLENNFHVNDVEVKTLGVIVGEGYEGCP